MRQVGGDWDLAKGLLQSWDLRIESVTTDDAERAADLWVAGDGLSLGARLCLALGERLDATVWTSDRQWMDRPGVRLIR